MAGCDPAPRCHPADAPAWRSRAVARHPAASGGAGVPGPGRDQRQQPFHVVHISRRHTQHARHIALPVQPARAHIQRIGNLPAGRQRQGKLLLPRRDLLMDPLAPGLEGPDQQGQQGRHAQIHLQFQQGIAGMQLHQLHEGTASQRIEGHRDEGQQQHRPGAAAGAPGHRQQRQEQQWHIGGAEIDIQHLAIQIAVEGHIEGRQHQHQRGQPDQELGPPDALRMGARGAATKHQRRRHDQNADQLRQRPQAHGRYQLRALRELQPGRRQHPADHGSAAGNEQQIAHEARPRQGMRAAAQHGHGQRRHAGFIEGQQQDAPQLAMRQRPQRHLGRHQQHQQREPARLGQQPQGRHSDAGR